MAYNLVFIYVVCSAILSVAKIIITLAVSFYGGRCSNLTELLKFYDNFKVDQSSNISSFKLEDNVFSLQVGNSTGCKNVHWKPVV